MKYTILLILLLFLRGSLFAQYTYVLIGDSVKFTNYDSCELIIENHSQGVPGFLYNKGRGRTEFRRAFISIDDSTYLVGPDTLRVPGTNFWLNNGSNIYNTNNGKVSIRRLSPIAMLDLPGAVNIDDSSSYRIHDSVIMRMDGLQSGTYTNFYLGSATGTGNAGIYDTYLGPVAGGDLVAGNNNTMAGSYAGAYNMLPAAPSGRNTFVGSFAAENNSGADLTVVGIEAADEEGGSSTIAIGNAATEYSGGKTNCLFLGDVTGTSADLSHTNLSTYIGGMAGAIETGAQNSNTLIGASTSILNSPSAPPSFASDATAIGYQATARTSNTMVFGDASVQSWLFNSSAATRSGAALIVGFNATNGNGAYLSSGGVWTNASDRAKKENFTTLDETEMLEKIGRLPVSRWNYKNFPERHIGPVAQDFYSIFQLGADDKSISTIDPSGIALAGVQGLYHQWQNNQMLSEGQQEELARLKKNIETQQAELNDLLAQFNEQEADLDTQDETIRQLTDKINNAAASRLK